MPTNLKISQMPIVEILKKDLIIDVEIDGDKLGEFRISQGSVDYYQKGAKTKHHRLKWAELADLMIKHGKER